MGISSNHKKCNLLVNISVHSNSNKSIVERRLDYSSQALKVMKHINLKSKCITKDTVLPCLKGEPCLFCCRRTKAIFLTSENIPDRHRKILKEPKWCFLFWLALCVCAAEEKGPHFCTNLVNLSFCWFQSGGSVPLWDEKRRSVNTSTHLDCNNKRYKS